MLSLAENHALLIPIPSTQPGALGRGQRADEFQKFQWAEGMLPSRCQPFQYKDLFLMKKFLRLQNISDLIVDVIEKAADGA